jgi:DNA-binding transcriptional regulator YiaG
MATLATALRSEVRRVMGGEVGKVLRPLRRLLKQVKALRQVTREQRRNLASVEARIDRLKARLALRRSRKGPRVSADAIRSFRSRVAMTREQFARLLGVSPGSIFGWETGRTTPRGRSAARFLEVRKQGVRAVRSRAAGAKGARRGRGRARVRKKR